MKYNVAIPFILLLFLISCKDTTGNPDQKPAAMQLISLDVGAINLLVQDTELPADEPFILTFNAQLNRGTVPDHVKLLDDQEESVDLIYVYQNEDRTVAVFPSYILHNNAKYTLVIMEGIRGAEGEIFPGFEKAFTTMNPPIYITQATINEVLVEKERRIKDIDLSPVIRIVFSEPVQASVVSDFARLTGGGERLPLSSDQPFDSVHTFAVVDEELQGYGNYKFSIASAMGAELNKPFDGYQFNFHTRLDSTPVFPEISDAQLLTRIQEQTFAYFWDFAHPVSGLARERKTSGEIVTSGGSGFGLMVILVGIERGFITRQEGIDRLETIVTFLDEKADRFHGAWSHWLSGTTGDAIAFSPQDNGGDLVETAFMVQGLLTVRQYLKDDGGAESALIEKIDSLWEEVEWSWYTRGENVLYWHWSPEFEWALNHQIRGYNEALIVYVLAASSPTYPINPGVYHEGWARGGGIINGQTYYGYTLPLGGDMGGPLFFAHYSFLGLDPRFLEDQYANYWQQNMNHTLVNRAYCIDNPEEYVGYTSYSWGLTASDGPSGYFAHSPSNDRGVITPTAAVSSLPYTPEESMTAIRHYYYLLGNRLWGEYGFYDAFNFTDGWVADSYIAIDQGPMVVMIENYRSGLLWELFMSAPEVQEGLDKLGFTYD